MRKREREREFHKFSCERLVHTYNESFVRFNHSFVNRKRERDSNAIREIVKRVIKLKIEFQYKDTNGR